MDAIEKQRIGRLTEDTLQELGLACCKSWNVFAADNADLFVVRFSCRDHGPREFKISIDASGRYESDDFLKNEIREKIATAKRTY